MQKYTDGHLYTSVHRKFIDKGAQLETSQMAIPGWMDEVWALIQRSITQQQQGMNRWYKPQHEWVFR